MHRLLPALIALVSLATSAAAQQTPAPADPNRWEPAIQKFEAEDKANPPAKGGIVFIGASSIARWTNLAESFPDLKVVNRGFGGSELRARGKYASRVVRAACAARRRAVCRRKRSESRRHARRHRVGLRQVLTMLSTLAARHAHRRHRAETVAACAGSSATGCTQTNKLIRRIARRTADACMSISGRR